DDSLIAFFGWHAMAVLLVFVEYVLYGTVAGVFVLPILTLVLREGVQARRDWIDQRTYSIGGKYKTLTKGSSLLKDENRDGEGYVHRNLRLRQTGRRIKGTE